MNRRSVVGVAVLAAMCGTALAFTQPDKSKPAQPDKAKPAAQPAAQPEIPGMSEADMKACMEAGTPGTQHEHLAQAVGVWEGKCTMWMAPGASPETSACTSTITSIMDGRFIRNETKGDMPGMGPFQGYGLSGFDNVAQKFQTTWIDNCGTGIMVGTGELSPDRKTMTWKLNYNCPITKKQTTMREVERRTGKDTMTLEMHGIEPHSGKEFKMMEIAYTRKPGTGPSAAATPAGGAR